MRHVVLTVAVALGLAGPAAAQLTVTRGFAVRVACGEPGCPCGCAAGGVCDCKAGRTRVLIVRHAAEPMASKDAKDARRRIERAGGFTVVGNVYCGSADALQQAVAAAASDCGPEDTLIVHTIGHGHGDGSLMALGQREGVFRRMARVAAERKRRVVWWQLSCHAAAGLPSVADLPDDQRRFFSVVASSPAEFGSGCGVQSAILGKLSAEMAAGGGDVDANHDGVVTPDELAAWLDRLGGPPRGKLVFADGSAGLFRTGPAGKARPASVASACASGACRPAERPPGRPDCP
jgi:hypothetical protein